MILGTDRKTAGRRLARYVAGLVLVVLERDGASTVRGLERPVAEAFDAHGLKLARDAAATPTAAAAAARLTGSVCAELHKGRMLAVFTSLGGPPRYALNARRIRVNHTEAAHDLGVGRSSVRRWVKAGMVQRIDHDTVALWQSSMNPDAYFPARAPLPKQEDLALRDVPVATFPPSMDRDAVLTALQGAPTDDEVRRAEAASVNLVVPCDAPAKPAPWTVDVREVAEFKADGILVQATRGDGGPSVKPLKTPMVEASNAREALRFARTLEAAALWALGGEP